MEFKTPWIMLTAAIVSTIVAVGVVVYTIASMIAGAGW